MTLLTVEVFLVVAGVYLAAMTVQIATDATHPRRIGSAVFWGLLAVIFLLGPQLPPVAVGWALLVIAALAGAKGVGPSRLSRRPPAEREAEALRLGNRLLWPAALIPLVAVLGGLSLGRIQVGGVALADPKQVTLIALGLACLIGLVAALRVTRASPRTALTEGSGLLQALGWAVVLPQLLASLGGVFARAGVGDVVAGVVGGNLPTHHPLVAVVAYCAGMALFTIVMGNAFAAFPVITLGIGLPFIVNEHGGNPAIMGALGMLSGYCGTLVTPMAANFNLVPAILLDIPDRHAVIKAQLPLAAAIWIFNVALMGVCVYRF